MLRRFELFTLSLVLLCVLWTCYGWARDWTPYEHGAVNRTVLWRGAYWRAFTTILVHGSWWHLLLNGLSLYLVGQAVARGCGRAVLSFCVLLGAWAGLGASLLWTGHDYWRIGISGGVFALLGLILALEWAVTDSVRAFFRERNTRLVLFFLALNVGLAIWFEVSMPGLIDHAGHVGGFAFGLLAGAAYYARPRRIRRVRGILVAALVGLGPLAYAAFPYWNADFFFERARRAEGAGDADAAEDAYERVLELRPGHPFAAARLAVLRDDPSLLSGVRPGRMPEVHAVFAAYLDLARRRFGADPGEALALVRSAARLPAPPELWLRFSQEAIEAGRDDLALLAVERLPESEAWIVASRVMDTLAKSLREAGPDAVPERARALAECLRRASFGLGDTSPLDDVGHERLELVLVVRLQELRLAADRVPPADRPGLLGEVSDVYRRIANNTGSVRTADYRAHAALVLEGTGAGPEALLPLWTAALQEARERENPRVERLAKAWFLENGLPVPGPELADPPDDG